MQPVVDRLIGAVQAMDHGTASEEDACAIFGAVRIPGFRFEQWLAEMVEEGVYVEATLR